MSNRSKKNRPVNNQGNGTPTGGNAPAQNPQKRGLIDRIVSGYHRIQAHPVGRWVVRVGKGAAAVGSGLLCYKAGQKSVKPVIVTVQDLTDTDEQNEQEAQETPETETEKD